MLNTTLGRCLRFATACFAVGVAGSAFAAQERILFETNVGDFEMILNPTDNPNVQPAADRLLELVNAGHFDSGLINRADPSGVVQFGTFVADPRLRDDLTSSGWPFQAPPAGLPDLIFDNDGDGDVDFDFLGDGLTNRRGTVAFALAAGSVNATGGSIFVSTVDNPFNIDGQGFVPFAVVTDLTVLDVIQSLRQEAYSATPTFSNVPLIDSQTEPTEFVVIERAISIPEPAAVASVAVTVIALGATRRRAQQR